ncbi:hypothetical protein MTsPCn9_34410 [Croceitalea sp. MTPC9]|uniref:hypothetical protein n=1 Tax=unclassified Croceitalea TaxID=2632280 RepID=UPI002B384327|nr:hypothetical protein MTsPCn6_34540 [Croceitalea sp. MTPC6]GMN18501.1 hypothetical protein MTsPCn9_34410 [Croceitalea sp. MTPC9]
MSKVSQKRPWYALFIPAKKVVKKKLDTGVLTESTIVEGVERINVISPKIDYKVLTQKASPLHVIDPEIVEAPTKPTFYISEHIVKPKSFWKWS